MVKALIMVLAGLALSYVGTDDIVGTLRFTFGLMPLYDGLNLAPLVMGLFGISEVLTNIESSDQTRGSGHPNSASDADAQRLG